MKSSFVIFLFLIFLNITGAQELITIHSISKIDSLRDESKNKVIMFNFWASWCKPCVKEFPDLIKLNQNYQDKGFVLILISLDFPDDVEGKVKPFLKSSNVNFPVYFGDFKNPDNVMNYFDPKWDGAIPATFIYDKNGFLKSYVIGDHDYNFYENLIKAYL